jgi:lipoprotein-anchoring transpeptidase ErfK/SrfK
MVRLSLPVTLGALLLSILGFIAFAATQRASSDERPQPAAPQLAEAAAPALEPIQAVAPPAPPKPPGTAILRVRAGETVGLRSKPRGKVVREVAAATQFGSPTTLTVAAQRGDWLGVTSTDLPNGELGWVKKQNTAVDQRRTKLAIRVDLSERRLRLVNGDRTLRTVTIGIGRPGSPTPTGRFAVTDKLNGANYGPYYGCCILALSGHQPNLPPGWPGGDRLAIHGTSNPAGIGGRPSAGCLHAGASDLQALMRRVPLGTPVIIRG